MRHKLAYRNYMLAVLMLISVVSILDRFVFALAIEAIRHDLQLSDTQIGLMTGIAFAAFYAIAGVPIARWADRGNRVIISALAVGLGGIMVSLSGMVGSFLQLLSVRVGVAVGEASTFPAAYSLIPDYFNRSERPRAMAFYAMSITISMIIGYLVGGWLLESYGWRTTFLLMGIPGVLVAILAKLTLKEPRLTQPPMSVDSQPAMTEVLRAMWRQRTFRHVFLLFCVSNFFTMGVSQWMAPFFMRSHGMGGAELGAWLALCWGVSGLAGNYLGGYCATRFAANREKIQMRALALVKVFYGLLSAMIYLSPNQYAALMFLALSTFLGAFVSGPLFASVQSLVNKRMRSVTLALILLCANLIGFGFGPLAIGILSDFFNPEYGEDSLRYVLALSCLGALWVAVHYWKAGNTIEEDIQEVEESAPATAITKLEEGGAEAVEYQYTGSSKSVIR